MMARHKGAWVWVAVAAMSLALVARAQTGAQNARAYTNPMLEFLAGHAIDQPDAARSAPRFSTSRSARLQPGAHSDTLATMLPVRFIGLVAPLNLVFPRSFLCIGRAPAAPAQPFSYQRPPPPQLL